MIDGKSDILVLIPTINEPTLEEVVISTKLELPEAEIIILGFGSSQNIANKHNVKFINLKTKTFKAIAINRAIQQTKNNKIIILDADAIPLEGWGDEMKKEFNQSEFFVCSVNINYGNYWMRSYNISMFHEYSYRKTREYRKYLPFISVGLTRSVFNKVGIVSENLERGEDYEWSLRAYKSGIIPVFSPKPVILHKPILKKTAKDIWKYWVETGKVNMHIRSMYPEIIKTPFFFRSPYLIFCMIPLLALLITSIMIIRSPKAVINNLNLIPGIYFTKFAYVYGIFKYLVMNKGNNHYG